MTWPAILFVILLAIILTAVFAGGFRRTGPWAGWWWFFLLVLLAGLLAVVWAEPVGPVWWGVAWLPILLLVLLFALLIAALTPEAPRGRYAPREPLAGPADTERAEVTPAETSAETTAAIAIGVFFWILLVGFIVAIIIGLLT